MGFRYFVNRCRVFLDELYIKKALIFDVNTLTSSFFLGDAGFLNILDIIDQRIFQNKDMNRKPVGITLNSDCRPF